MAPSAKIVSPRRMVRPHGRRETSIRRKGSTRGAASDLRRAACTIRSDPPASDRRHCRARVCPCRGMRNRRAGSRRSQRGDALERKSRDGNALDRAAPASVDCTPAMPPQACKIARSSFPAARANDPTPRCRWSRPSSCVHRRVLFAPQSRRGGAHLATAPSRSTSSSVKNR